MPELPEVASVCLGLQQLVAGSTIAQVAVYWPRIVTERGTVSQFGNLVNGCTIRQVSRRAKYIIFDCGPISLVAHLRMEGKFYVLNTADEPMTKHTHVVFTLTDGRRLCYEDVRKFGRITALSTTEVAAYFAAKKLGVEPLSAQFDVHEFYQALQQRSQALKPLLLQQQIVVGLGNIYADEVLFQAQLHPEQAAHSLTFQQVERLHTAIITVLQQAVALGGSTIRTYQNSLREAGSFQQHLHVYQQHGKPCTRCGTVIVKQQLFGRGTHFCPQCQKQPNAT